jgi:hypothetical protein
VDMSDINLVILLLVNWKVMWVGSETIKTNKKQKLLYYFFSCALGAFCSVTIK